MKPSKVLPHLCKGYLIGEEKRIITDRDAIIYALGTAACQDPLDKKDLKFCNEGSSDGFDVLPSFSTSLISFPSVLDALLKCPGLPEFNPMMLLHGEQKVTNYLPLPLNSETVTSKAYVKDVIDRKSGAVVVVALESEAMGKLICVNEYHLFIRGIGKFLENAENGQTTAITEPVPDRQPDKSYEVDTPQNLALLYRLSGDLNPLHVDSEMAQMGGFKRPILHGLCTLGIAIRVVVREMCDNKVQNFSLISCRFTSPTTPGDKLRVCMWEQGALSAEGLSLKKIHFRVINLATEEKVVLDRGIAVIEKQIGRL